MKHLALLLVALVAAPATAFASPTSKTLIGPGGTPLPGFVVAGAFCESSHRAVFVLGNGEVVAIDAAAAVTPVHSLGTSSGQAAMTCDSRDRIVVAAARKLTVIDGTTIMVESGPAVARNARLLDDGTASFFDGHSEVWRWSGITATHWSFAAVISNYWSAAIHGSGTSIAVVENHEVVIYGEDGTKQVGPKANALAWSPDGKSLLITGFYGLGRWTPGTPPTAVEMLSAGMRGDQIRVAGTRVFVTRFDAAEVREIDAQGKLVNPITVERLPMAQLIFAVGNGVAVVASDRFAWWMDLTKSGDLIDRQHPVARVRGLAFSPDGKLLAALGGDHDVLVASTGKPNVRRLSITSPIFGPYLQWTRDGIVAAGGSYVHWDKTGTPTVETNAPAIGLTREGERIEWTRDRRIVIHRNGGNPIEFAIGGDPKSFMVRAEASATRLALRRGMSIELYPLDGSTPIATSNNHRYITASTFVSDERVVFAADGKLYVLDAAGEQELTTLPAPAEVMAATADGTHVALALASGHIMIWNTLTNAMDDVLPTQPGASSASYIVRASALAWSPNGNQLAVATPDGIELWKL